MDGPGFGGLSGSDQPGVAAAVQVHVAAGDIVGLQGAFPIRAFSFEETFGFVACIVGQQDVGVWGRPPAVLRGLRRW